MGRPDSELYRGVRLARALDWRADKDTALTEVERQFLEASSRRAEAEQQSIVERARAQARLIRRQRIALVGGAVLLVLALVAGVLAAVQSGRANENAARAEQAAVSADARRVGARSQLTDDISLSLLLAAAGARLEDSPETRVNLMTALADRSTLVRSAPPGGGYLETFDVSRDGRWIASSDGQNRMNLYDAATNRLKRSYDPVQPSGHGWLLSAFSPDSRQLAVALEAQASTEPVRLLDTNTMRSTTRLDIPGNKRLWGVVARFSADGRYLAGSVHEAYWPEGNTGDAKGYVLVWDLDSASTPFIRVPTGNDAQGVGLSPDGQILYTDWPLTAYRVSDGEQLWQRGEVKSLANVDVNAKGTLLALADTGGTNVLVVRASDGETVRTLRGHQEQVRDIRFSPDGSLVGSVSLDGELIVWETATGRRLEQWDTSDQWGVGFSPDGDLVYGGGGESMLRTWDLSMQETYLQQTTQVDDGEDFAHADLSPDGQQVAYSWLDRDTGWVRFIDTDSGEETPPARVPVAPGPYASGAWDAQGEKYVAYNYCFVAHCGAGGPGVVVLDAATGTVLDRRRRVAGSVFSIAVR